MTKAIKNKLFLIIISVSIIFIVLGVFRCNRYKQYFELKSQANNIYSEMVESFDVEKIPDTFVTEDNEIRLKQVNNLLNEMEKTNIPKKQNFYYETMIADCYEINEYMEVAKEWENLNWYQQLNVKTLIYILKDYKENLLEQ